MRSSKHLGSGNRIGRRTFLGGVGAAIGASVVSGTASGDSGGYDPVDMVEAGADPDGEEPINDVLEEVAYGNDEVALKFPPGEYRMDEQFRFTDMESFAMFGDDATIVPASGDEFEGPARLFKLGTADHPAGWVRIQGLDFDYTAPNTGLRALQIQANDMYVANVDCYGTHDGGTFGPYLFDVLDADSIAVVRDVRAPDGGKYTDNTEADYYPSVSGGPTGIITGPPHEGKLWYIDCELGGFPGNGLYSSADQGTVVVHGGEYRNSNVANIRLDGDHCYIKHAKVVVDESRPEDHNQRGIRFDEGEDYWVYDTTIEMSPATGDAIRATNEAHQVTIQEVDITVDDPEHAEDAIAISPGCTEARIFESEIEMRSGGQAIQIAEGNGDAPVLVEDVEITGDADGGFGGAHAIRCNRDGSRFYNLTVDQPGDAYRRCMDIDADDCIVAFGEFRSTHHPIINHGSGTGIVGIEAEAYNDSEAIKLYEADDLSLYDCTLYGGIENASDTDLEDVDVHDNTYPSA